MQRAPRGPINARTTLAIGLASAAVLAVLPTRWTQWTRGLRAPVELAVGPVQAPVHRVASWLTPGRSAKEDDPRIAELRRQRDLWHQQYLRAQERIGTLDELVRQLSRGGAVLPDIPIRQVHAPVIGDSRWGGGTMLKVKAGSDRGVSPGSVAVMDGVWVVGRVVDVEALVCRVLPITDTSSSMVEGVVMLDDQTRGPRVLLSPTGGGSALRGRVEYTEADQGGDEPEPGMVVRLQDPSWQDASQMLILGVVERVERSEAQPLRREVVVRPAAGLDRVSEVTIRVPDVGAREEGGS